MSLGTNTLPAGYWLGSDTFRGTLKGTGTGGLGQALSETLRCELYNKNEGHVTKDRCQLVRTESPISGDLLISNGSVVQAVKDPLTGERGGRAGGAARGRHVARACARRHGMRCQCLARRAPQQLQQQQEHAQQWLGCACHAGRPAAARAAPRAMRHTSMCGCCWWRTCACTDARC